MISDVPKAGLKTLNHRSDWNTARLKFLFSRETRPVLETDEVVTAFRDGTVTLRKNRREDGFTFAEKEIGYQGIEPGDLVVHAMDGFAGAIGVSDSRGKGSPVLSIATPISDAEPRFWAYYLRNLAVTGFIQSLAKGIRERSTDFRWKDASNLLVNFPNLATQRQIADFLERETARIDLLIEKKQRLVSLIKEERASAISSAVTVGFGNASELVPTNSRYIPSVPPRWAVWRLKHLGEIRGGLTLGRKLPEDQQTVSTPYVRVANVQAGWLDLSDVAEIPVLPTELKRYRLLQGDVLMNEGGDNDKLGRGAVWNSEIETCVHQNHVFAMRPYDTRLSEWISLATNARYARDFFYLHSNQSTNLASVSKTNLSRFPVAIPPPEEMYETLEKLDARISKLDEIADKTSQSIDRLKEYRSAVITAAVTGQIEVESHSKSGTTGRRLDALQEEMDA